MIKFGVIKNFNRIIKLEKCIVTCQQLRLIAVYAGLMLKLTREIL